MTKSPLLAAFSEMVSGVELVRAFGQQARFAALSDARCDDANRALFCLWLTNQWLRVSMNLVGSLVTATVAGAVLWQRRALGDGAAGLTLSYATQFTQTVMWAFRMATQLEVSMNDVERAHECARDAAARRRAVSGMKLTAPSPLFLRYATQLPLEAYDAGDAAPAAARRRARRRRAPPPTAPPRRARRGP